MPPTEMVHVFLPGARSSGVACALMLALVATACTPERVTEPLPVDEPVATDDWRFTRGFVWTRESGFTLLPAVQGEGVFPYGINSRGEIAGTVYNVPLERKRAFIWSNASGITYLDPSGSWARTEAVAINDAGFVAGRVASRTGFSTGLFLWHRDSGMLTAQVGQLASASTDPKALNASGHIFGNFVPGEVRGFRWRLRPDAASIPEFLSYNVEYPNSYVVAANDAGEVLGYNGQWDAWDLIVSHRKPILWTATGDLVDLFPDCARPCDILVAALNNAGFIAGTSSGQVFRRSPSGSVVTKAMAGSASAVAMNSTGDVVGVIHGNGTVGSWLWTAAGESMDLGKPSGATMVYATAINDRGQVTGFVK